MLLLAVHCLPPICCLRACLRQRLHLRVPFLVRSHRLCSGLDNAGKTTIVKRISGEDASTVSPTLGFNIKTLEFAGWVLLARAYTLSTWAAECCRRRQVNWRMPAHVTSPHRAPVLSPLLLLSPLLQLPAECVGRGWAAQPAAVLAQLF